MKLLDLKYLPSIVLNQINVFHVCAHTLQLLDLKHMWRRASLKKFQTNSAKNCNFRKILLKLEERFF